MELSEGHKSRCSMTTDEYGKEGINSLEIRWTES